jgi:hypothetical protein
MLDVRRREDGAIMRTNSLIVSVITLCSYFSFSSVIGFCVQSTPWADVQKATLYARQDPKDKDYDKSSYSFQYGVRSDVGKEVTKNDWDIKFGYTTINDSSDYFGVTMLSSDRSRIKNLGKKNWSDLKQVPVLLANAGPYKGIRFPLNGESIDVTSEGQIAKVIEGNMYVAHIKDVDTDLYVLFRVEELVPNDRCTISWKVVPSPEEKK